MQKENIVGQIHNSIYQNIQKKGFVAPIDVLLDIGVLFKEDYENWRFGRVSYLEKVCQVNLRKLSVIMKEIRKYAINNNLESSYTFYRQWGCKKKIQLRFSKSYDEGIERNYSTHFLKVNNDNQLTESGMGMPKISKTSTDPEQYSDEKRYGFIASMGRITN